jgi:hypothetical protein
MGPVNTLPLGFLGLLGLNQLGRNLTEVADSIAGTLDLTPFYAAYRRDFLVNDSAFAAATTSTVIVATVPSGQYWYMIGGVLAAISGAAATGRGGVRIESQGRAVFASDYVSVATAQTGENTPINFETSIPLILQPGDVIYKTGYGLAGAGVETLAVRIAYLPLQG